MTDTDGWEPVDPEDVREGDRVRLTFTSGQHHYVVTGPARSEGPRVWVGAHGAGGRTLERAVPDWRNALVIEVPGYLLARVGTNQSPWVNLLDQADSFSDWGVAKLGTPVIIIDADGTQRVAASSWEVV